MFWETADQVIHREAESVRVRRVILDQLEGGHKTGKELREAIRKDMAAQALEAGAESVNLADFNVTDPKLYFNTKRLEELGIITSRKDSQHRKFALTPWAVQPVRRVLGVIRPVAMLTSMSRPEDQRPFVTWLNDQKDFDVSKLHVIVEDRTFTRGSMRNLERYLPKGAKPKWETVWNDMPVDATGNFDTNIPGDLMATQREIDKIIIDNLTQYDLVIDLSAGPPLIVLALSLLAMHYSITAIFVRHKDGENALTRVLPRE
ncbi:MAG: winged helix-turn-helix domain-containing protein [Candidatus Thorarchaeota archaeon]